MKLLLLKRSLVFSHFSLLSLPFCSVGGRTGLLAACCVADVMGDSRIVGHWLVSSETRVAAQFHSS